MLIAGVSILILLMSVGGFIFVLVALIYIIRKRMKEKQSEDFEKRNVSS